MNYDNRKKYAEELIRQDKYPDALNEYNILFKENPKDPQNIGRFSFLFDRINDGNYDFKPETAEHFLMRGTAKFYKDEFENSIKDFDKALSLDSNCDYALKLRAFSLKFLGRMEEAITDLNKAINIKPTGDYYDDLSEIYQLIGDYTTALKYHQNAIEISPENARLWFNYGVDLFESGNLKEALNKYNKAIELWPDYEDAIVNRQYVLNILERQNAL